MKTKTLLKAIDPVDTSEVELISANPVFEELRQDILATEPQVRELTTTLEPVLRRSVSGRRRLVAVIGAVAVVALLAGFLVVGSRPSNKPMASQTGTWKLADDVLSGTWHQFDSGPPPGTLSCPTSTRCYAMSGHYDSPVAGAPMLSESLYVSVNGGATWGARPMPRGFASTSPVSCGGSTMCAAGGTDGGDNVLATTSDGGKTWTIDPLPSGVGHLDTLSCASANFCAGLAADSEVVQIGGTDATFLSTTNLGKSFSNTPIVEGDSMESLVCTSNVDCAAIGWNDAEGPNDLGAGVAVVTTDGGQTWMPSVLPLGLGVDSNSQVSCSDELHCSMLGQVVIPEQDLTECPANASVPPPGEQSAKVQVFAQAEAQAAMSEKQTFQCPGSGSSSFVVEAIASTQDGGASWSLDSLPSNLPQPYFSDLSCPTADECWATGEAAVPRQVGTGRDDGSPILIGTADGGATWSNVTFGVPQDAPNYYGQSFLSMGWIACPTSATCVVLGTAAQGAPSVPTYNLGVSDTTRQAA